MTERTFVLGTRKSKLALWQANHVGNLLTQKYPAFKFRLETFVTSGDIKIDQPLPEIGGKGLFTQELENALLDGSIDFVVHSLKDLPVDDAPGLSITAIPVRENPRDVLIAKDSYDLTTLPQGARVGTSSLRRSAQLLANRSDLKILPLRGNVDTRIRKAMDGDYDAIILAAAGVYRLGFHDFVRQEIPLELMLPAPGQGAIAIQSRRDDQELNEILSLIEDQNTYHAILAERSFLKFLGGGCSAPVAAFAQVQQETLLMDGLVASLDGKEVLRVNGQCKNTGEAAIKLGQALAESLSRQGGGRILQMIKGEA